MKKYLLVLFIFISVSAMANPANQYRREQQRQERTIERAWRQGALTEREYQQLMRAQDRIIRTIQISNRDRFWTPMEIHRVENLLDREAIRIRRYARN